MKKSEPDQKIKDVEIIDETNLDEEELAIEVIYKKEPFNVPNNGHGPPTNVIRRAHNKR